MDPPIDTQTPSSHPNYSRPVSLPQQNRTLPPPPRPIRAHSTDLHPLLQLTHALIRNRDPTTKIIEPILAAPIRKLNIVYRAGLDTATQIAVLDILDIADVFALVVGLVAVERVGEGSVVQEVRGGLRGVGGRRVD